MLYNRLYVKPTDQTLSYLSALLSGAPVDIDINSLNVEIITTEDALTIDPNRVYRTHVTDVRVFYDSYLQRSNLMLTLQSPDLMARAKELAEEGVVRAFYDVYIPHMALIRGTPPMSRAFRAWRLGIANALIQNGRVLDFTGEYVELDDVLARPDFDYVAAMADEANLRQNG